MDPNEDALKDALMETGAKADAGARKAVTDEIKKVMNIHIIEKSCTMYNCTNIVFIMWLHDHLLPPEDYSILELDQHAKFVEATAKDSAKETTCKSRKNLHVELKACIYQKDPHQSIKLHALKWQHFLHYALSCNKVDRSYLSYSMHETKCSALMHLFQENNIRGLTTFYSKLS